MPSSQTLVETVVQSWADSGGIFRTSVDRVLDDGTVSVCSHDPHSDSILCDVLSTAEQPPRFVAGENVLVWRSEDSTQGVILGRLGPAASPSERHPSIEPASCEDVPDEVVLQAKKSLTIRCGEGAITLRPDGKVLIKGKDLVSRATRMNRVQGGAVAIN